MVEVSNPVPGNMAANFSIALSFLYKEDFTYFCSLSYDIFLGRKCWWKNVLPKLRTNSLFYSCCLFRAQTAYFLESLNFSKILPPFHKRVFLTFSFSSLSFTFPFLLMFSLSTYLYFCSYLSNHLMRFSLTGFDDVVPVFPEPGLCFQVSFLSQNSLDEFQWAQDHGPKQREMKWKTER